MKAALAAQAFDRSFGTARSLLVNLYAEQSPEEPTESRRVPRPGLAVTFHWYPRRGMVQ